MLYKPQLPSDWHYIRIGDCCDILDNQRIPVNSEERWKRQGTIPYYGANGQQGWIDDYIFDEELVLIAEDGGFFDEYETRPIAYIINGKSWVNNHAHVLRAKEITTNHWVFYNLVHKDIRFYIKGGTRSKLNQSELREIEIPLCNIDEQHKIIKILLDIDKVISKTEQLITKLKQIKAGLLHDLLTRGLDENGELRDPVAHPDQFKDTVLGKTPLSWQVSNLGDCLLVLYRYPSYYGIQYVDNGVPEVRSELIDGNGNLSKKKEEYRYVSEETAKRFSRVRLESGDFVMSVRGTLGKVAMIPEWLQGSVITANLIRMKFDPYKVCCEWAKHYLCSRMFLDALEDFSSGTTIKTIQAPMISRILFSLPPIEEQKAVANILNLCDKNISDEELKLEKLRLIKSGLMHDLLTGKVRVPSDKEGE